jgi:hypothetical protein
MNNRQTAWRVNCLLGKCPAPVSFRLGAIRRLQVTNRRLPVGHRTGTSPNFCRSASLIWSITASRKPLCGADERMPDFA